MQYQTNLWSAIGFSYNNLRIEVVRHCIFYRLPLPSFWQFQWAEYGKNQNAKFQTTFHRRRKEYHVLHLNTSEFK